MAYRTSPRYQARVQQRTRRDENVNAAATAERERTREVVGRPPLRPEKWNTAPVLDPLVDMYRR
jgi:hypothetical protein